MAIVELTSSSIMITYREKSAIMIIEIQLWPSLSNVKKENSLVALTHQTKLLIKFV